MYFQETLNSPRILDTNSVNILDQHQQLQLKICPVLRGNAEIPITSIPTEIEHFIRELNCALLLRFQVPVNFLLPG